MSGFIFSFLGLIGYCALQTLGGIGRLATFAGQIFWQLLVPPYRPALVLRSFWELGYLSLPVVGLTAIFSGMVLALQSYTGFARFAAQDAIPQVVVISLTRELGPVLAGLMVSGRVGASIASELGAMRVSDQIEALRVLSTNPISYLVVPRVLAGTLMLPLLVLVADIIGVLGGYSVSIYRLGFASGAYLDATWSFLQAWDVWSGLIKASVFGFIVTLLGCYFGFSASKGAAGVGRASTQAVVWSAISILVCNYLITEALFAR